MPREAHATTLRVITAVFCVAGTALITIGLVSGLPTITTLGAISVVMAAVNLSWAVAADAHAVAVAVHDRLDRHTDHTTARVDAVDQRIDTLIRDIEITAAAHAVHARHRAA